MTPDVDSVSIMVDLLATPCDDPELHRERLAALVRAVREEERARAIRIVESLDAKSELAGRRLVDAIRSGKELSP